MSGYDNFQTLVMCFGQVLASMFYNSFKYMNRITPKNCINPDFYLPGWVKFAPPYTSPYWHNVSYVIGYGCLYPNYG